MNHFSFPRPKFKKVGLLGCIVVIAIFSIVLIPAFVTVVEAGEVGVYSLFGEVKEEELQPGINFKIPFAKITKMNVRTQEYTMSSIPVEGAIVGDDSIEARAADGAALWLDITVLYHLNSDSAVDVYKNIGTDYEEKIVRPAIRSKIRSVVSQFKVDEVYSTRRGEVEGEILDGLKEDLGERGIVVEEILLRKVNVSAVLFDSIEDKLAAKQEAEKYEYILDKEEQEADRKRIEAEGQKDAQKTISESITTEYLYYLYIQSLKDREGTIYVPVNPENGLPLFNDINQ